MKTEESSVESPEFLGELEALLAEATPAPWHRDRTGQHLIAGDLVVADGRVLCGQFAESLSETDARLIAALRNAAPALIAEVRRLRAIEATARALVDAIGGAGTVADDQLLDLKEALATTRANVNGEIGKGDEP
jgi:hypothetical protein